MGNCFVMPQHRPPAWHSPQIALDHLKDSPRRWRLGCRHLLLSEEPRECRLSPEAVLPEGRVVAGPPTCQPPPAPLGGMGGIRSLGEAREGAEGQQKAGVRFWPWKVEGAHGHAGEMRPGRQEAETGRGKAGLD